MPSRYPATHRILPTFNPSNIPTSPYPPDIDILTTLRVVFQNPNGIHPHHSHHDQNTAHNSIRDLSIGVLCLAETNCDWSESLNTMDNTTTFKRYHSATKIAYSSQRPTIRPPTHCLPGGTLTAALGPWVNRVSNTILDPSGMGRWSGLVLEGRSNRRTAIMTCYRVPAATLSSAGPLTSYSRQASVIAALPSSTSTPCPRQHCLDDLAIQIHSLITTNHEIILCIDANQSIAPMSTLKSFLINTGLEIVNTKSAAESYSHKRGSSTIDHIFVTPTILPHILQSGDMSFDTIYDSDHRPIYIDLAQTLFNATNIQILKAPNRILKSNDVKDTAMYITKMEALLDDHNIVQRLQLLESQLSLNPTNITTDSLLDYQTIDKELGEFMISAERICRRPANRGQYDWSPALKFCVAKAKQFKTMINNHPTNPSYRQLYKDEIARFKELKRNSRQLRYEYLASRAADPQCPKAIIKIAKAERARQSFAQVRHLFSKPRHSLTRITFGPDDNIQSTTDPVEIEVMLIERNQTHLGQAQSTPFATEPGKSIIELSLSNWDNLLNSSTLPDMPADIQTILNTLRTIKPSDERRDEIRAKISMEEFKRIIKDTPEKTSSSPSGRHLGHYKTALLSPTLLSVLLTMTALPFQYGFSPLRWKTLTDTMLEKIPGNPHISKLRIIQLMEADLNMGLKILWARRLRPTLRSTTQLDPAQHGCRPARSTIAPTLNKIVTYDISRTTRSPGLFLENDATAAFDRVIPLLAVLTSYAHGISFEACQSLYTTATQAIHHIRTGYGVSESSYTSSPTNPLFGCGQGSGASPVIWTLQIDLLFKSISNQSTPGTVVSSPSRNLNDSRTFDAFVDDTCVSVFQTPIPDISEVPETTSTTLLTKLTALAQLFSNLLHTIGGKLNLAKCHVTPVSYQPTISLTHDTRPIALQLNDPETNETTILHNNPPHIAYRTLGFYIAADGSQQKQLAILTNRVHQWSSIMTASRLTASQRFTAYTVFLLPVIRYLLPITTIAIPKLSRLYQHISTIVTHSLGLNRHFPQAILFGPTTLGGLALPNWEILSISSRLHTLVYHLHVQDPTGILLAISIQWTQLELGIGTMFLNRDSAHLPPYYTNTWVTALWQDLSTFNISFEYPASMFHNLILPPKVNDHCLMDIILQGSNYSTNQVQAFNYCRLFLRVLHISDISNAAGTHIDSAYRGHQQATAQRRHSHLSWPTLPHQPSKSQWELWTAMIKTTVCDKLFKLRRPLGPWQYPTHQHWPIRLSTDPMPTYTLQLRPNDPPTFLSNNSTRTLRQPHVSSSNNVPSQHPPLIHIASYQHRQNEFIILSTGLGPAIDSAYPITSQEVKWNITNTPTSPPNHDYITSRLRANKYNVQIFQKLSKRLDTPIEENKFEWQGLSKFLSSIKMQQRANFAKFQQEWLPTHSRLHNFNPTAQSPLCPLCLTEPETQRHLYCCTDHRAQATRIAALTSFRQKLIKANISSSIQTAICDGLKHLAAANPSPDIAHHAPYLRDYIELQNNIGWYSLLLGYIPTALFDSITYEVKVSRKTWISRIIDALYHYHLEIWSFRNTAAHDPSIDQLDTVHLRLYQSVLAWYDRCHELTPAGRSLLPADPTTLQNLSILALSELNEQISNFHLLWTRKPPNTQDIRNFFAPIQHPSL